MLYFVSTRTNSQEATVKSFVVVLILAFGTALSAQQPVPEIPFDSVPNFFKLPPDMHFGEASGVACGRRASKWGEAFDCGVHG